MRARALYIMQCPRVILFKELLYPYLLAFMLPASKRVLLHLFLLLLSAFHFLLGFLCIRFCLCFLFLLVGPGAEEGRSWLQSQHEGEYFLSCFHNSKGKDNSPVLNIGRVSRDIGRYLIFCLLSMRYEKNRSLILFVEKKRPIFYPSDMNQRKISRHGFILIGFIFLNPSVLNLNPTRHPTI